MPGGAGDDTVAGNRGDDPLVGGSGADVIDGGRGADALKGGFGADVFAVRAGEGRDVVLDLAAGDRVDVHTFDFDDVDAVAALLRGRSWGTALYLGEGDVVRLEGVALSTLDAADFVV